MSTSGEQRQCSLDNAPDSDYHPLSISAGVEKGHLNRYRNIFPYDSARCRLTGLGRGDDYINASHISLCGSNKTYIASQGPLNATAADFWHLVYQENVAIIIMLTRLQEAGREKCTNYLIPGNYGDITLCSTEGDALSDSSEGSNYFSDSSQSKKGDRIIQRVFEIELRGQPKTKRRIDHLQLVSWPDFDVPPEPVDVLNLLDQVKSIETRRADELKALSACGSSQPPILVHCSAGVGRTGTFIAIDVLLDVIRQAADRENPSDAMDVDCSSCSSNPLLEDSNPVLAVVDRMREARMSMVANAAQYTFTYRTILEALAKTRDRKRQT